MTPRRGAGRGGTPRPAGRRGRRARKRGRGRSLVFAFLGLVAAGAGGLALYLGFVPGPESWLGARTGPARQTDTIPRPSALPMDAGREGAVPDGPVAPASADTADAALAVTPADSVAGDLVYHGIGRCVGCHGAFGEGAPGLGPALTLSPGRLGDGSVAAIARVVARGAPPAPEAGFRIAMPSYAGQLSADDVTRVAAYVYTLSHPTSQPPSGPVNADTLTTGIPRTP